MALRYLRDPCRPRIMWIDALCIDQSSVEERNHQVGQMGVIYRKASSVIAWLGEASIDSDIALNALVTLSKDVHFSQSPIWSSQAADRHGADWVKEPVNAIDNLFKRPWWNRIWCVQEIVLAQNAVIVCGRRSIPWDTFLSSNRNFIKHRGCCQSYFGESSLNRFLTLGECLTRVNLRDFTQSKLSMLTNLEDFCGHECSDDRDKVYSLLATGDFEDAVQPDYSLSVPRVYQQLALATMKSLGSLEVLNSVVYRESRQDIPSWVPDWRQPFVNRYISWAAVGLKDASGGSKPDVQMLKDGELLLNGYFVDYVQYLSFKEQKLYSNSKVSDANLHYSHWEEIADIAQPEQRSEGAAGDEYDQFCRTILMDRQRSNDGWNVLNATGYDRFHQWRRWLQTGSGLIQETPNDVCTIWDMSHCISILNHCAFFRTQQGYFGIGSLQTKVGDSIFVLAGGDRAYILRIEGNEYIKDGVWHPYYVVIGWAYVEGIMKGEAVQDIVDGEEEWQEICLR